MTLAFCILAECPHCGEKKELFQLGSGNNIGSKTWSDLKIEMPMMPMVSPVQKCPKCGHFFMLREAKKEQGKTYSFEGGWLTFEESLLALEELKSDKKGRLELLTLIVTWAYNDIQRKEQESDPLSPRKEKSEKTRNTPTPEQTEIFRSVIKELLEQGIYTNNELFLMELYKELGLQYFFIKLAGELILAELYREIGEFDKCIHILEKFEPQKKFHELVKNSIIEHAKQQDSNVFCVSGK